MLLFCHRILFGFFVWWGVTVCVAVLWWTIQTPPLVDYATKPQCDAASLWRLDINAAPWTEFDTLPGLGETLSKSIVADRETRGAFSSIDDLMRVRGIGSKRLAILRPFLAEPATPVNAAR